MALDIGAVVVKREVQFYVHMNKALGYFLDQLFGLQLLPPQPLCLRA